MVDWTSKLIEAPRPADALGVVRAYRANALASVGLSGNPAQRAAFADLLAPRTLPDATPERRVVNDASRAAIMHVLRFPFSLSLPPAQRGISTCGMTAEGADARMGADASCLFAPYAWGMSVSRAIAYHIKHGAWTDASKADPGDRPPMCAYVAIGLTRPKTLPPGQPWDWGGIEHAFRIVGRDLDAGIFTSVDGGSVDSKTGLQCVKLVTRRWAVIRGNPWLVDPKTGQGRRVLGWGDPALLAFRPGLPMVVPEGWEGVDVDG